VFGVHACFLCFVAISNSPEAVPVRCMRSLKT
jgi:hypothetical protein